MKSSPDLSVLTRPTGSLVKGPYVLRDAESMTTHTLTRPTSPVVKDPTSHDEVESMVSSYSRYVHVPSEKGPLSHGEVETGLPDPSSSTSWKRRRTKASLPTLSTSVDSNPYNPVTRPHRVTTESEFLLPLGSHE